MSTTDPGTNGRNGDPVATVAADHEMTGAGLNTPILELRDVAVEFPVSGTRQRLRAVDGVSLRMEAGSTFGLIGESGSGKSTVARAIMGLTPVAEGEVLIEGRRFDRLKGRKRREARRRVQMVFQDPHDSLDPRMTIAQSIAEPITALEAPPRDEVNQRVAELLDRVGLDANHGRRKPYALSGGQKQRVNIARALALDPALLICDEAVSALDVSVQAGILNLLAGIQAEKGLGYFFISHDIGVVGHISDVIGVMYLGRLVEVAPTAALLDRPAHPYTEALLASEPEALPASERRPKRNRLEGDIPSPLDPPSGCRFRTRCPYVQDRCATETPALRTVDGRQVACHFAETLELAGRSGTTTSDRPNHSTNNLLKETP